MDENEVLNVDTPAETDTAANVEDKGHDDLTRADLEKIRDEIISRLDREKAAPETKIDTMGYFKEMFHDILK